MPREPCVLWGIFFFGDYLQCARYTADEPSSFPSSMCLIICKPPGRSIPAEFLANAWARNGDGWGAFFAHEGRLQCCRGLSYPGLMAANTALPRHAQVYLHLRKATCGHVNESMTHPLVVRPGLLLMHNGTFPGLVPGGADSDKSDTWELARLLRDLTSGMSDVQVQHLIRSEGFRRLSAVFMQRNVVVLQDEQGSVRLGRAWHRVTEDEWDASMVGVEVSNRHAWTPKIASAL